MRAARRLSWGWSRRDGAMACHLRLASVHATRMEHQFNQYKRLIFSVLFSDRSIEY